MDAGHGRVYNSAKESTMITTWKEFDAYVAEDVATFNYRSGMLNAQMTVLLMKRMMAYDTPADVVQRVLKERYAVEYSLAQITYTMMELVRAEHARDSFTLTREIG